MLIAKHLNYIKLYDYPKRAPGIDSVSFETGNINSIETTTSSSGLGTLEYQNDPCFGCFHCFNGTLCSEAPAWHLERSELFDSVRHT